jgi:hypothetical protein
VEHYHESAHIATDELTLDQFHRWTGHILPESAHKLVSQGLVTGVILDLTDPFSANPASMPNRAVNLFRRLERARGRRILEARYIATFGVLHQLNLEEGRDIISPLQMIKHASLTFTCVTCRSTRKQDLFDSAHSHAISVILRASRAPPCLAVLLRGFTQNIAKSNQHSVITQRTQTYRSRVLIVLTVLV